MKFLKNNKSLLSFSSSTIFLNLTKLIANILIIKWILPEDLGIWNTIIVIQNYIVLLNCGTTIGLNRELPFVLGKKLKNIAKGVAETALFISVVAAIISFFLILGAVEFTESRGLRLSLFALSLVVSSRFLNMYFSTTFRTNQAFLLFSKINIGLVALEIITLLLPAKLDYEGFLIRMVIIELIKLGFFILYQPFPVKPKFSKFSFVFLVKTGVPLFFSVYLSSVAETFKRIILKHLSSFEIVGLFSPALAVHSLNAMLPNTLGQFIFPRLSYSIGKGDSIKSQWKPILKVIMLNIFMILPFVLVGWFLLPHAINVYFPQYSAGILAARIALLSAVFVPFKILINLFNSVKNWKVIYVMVVVKLILYFCFQWFCTKSMEPLEGMAYGIFWSDLSFAVAILIVSFIYINSVKK